MRSLRETITQRQRCVIPQKCDTTQQHGFHSARMEAMYGARIASAHANSTAHGLYTSRNCLICMFPRTQLEEGLGNCTLSSPRLSCSRRQSMRPQLA